MSDGSKEIGNVTRKPSGNDDFVRAIAKIAVTQICEKEGFQGFQNSALESLADVAVRYVMELGKTSNLYANHGNRSECNLFDVILGLENLGSIQTSSSDVAKSRIVREISQYVNLVEANPFVFSLPRFPFSKARKNPSSSFLQLGKDPPHHIPPWLPAFPFDQSVGVQGEVQLPQQQPQLTANNGPEAVETNPFLVPPLAFGEKEVSVVQPPSRIWECNHVHMMDTYAPVEENDGKEVDNTKNTDVKLDGRPALRFKLSKSRKSLRVHKNVVFEMNGEDERIPVLFERNDENEEMMKGKAVFRESMDAPQLDTTES